MLEIFKNMDSGISFFKSKLARRFCLLFILCAFTPTVILIVISYNQVVGQLEEQSYMRLKSEVKAYSVSLFDRMLRINDELRAIGRFISPHQSNFSLLNDQYKESFEELFLGVVLYTQEKPIRNIYNSIESDHLAYHLTDDILQNRKPFILTQQRNGEIAKFFFGITIRRPSILPYTLVAEVRPDYLWGIGAAPLLPPLTDLNVYDRTGTNLLAVAGGLTESYVELKKKLVQKSLNVFEYEHQGKLFHAGISNLFIESHFQKTGWVIILSRARQDVMSAMDNFKQTFPFIILFFLVLIIYLSMLFIRRGLDPLEKLKQGTLRVAQRDFSTGVEIKSGDEFEELGNAFNTMASRLDNQFTALNVLSEIDRAILSSLDRQKTVATTLHRLKEFFDCILSVYVRMPESAAGHLRIYSLDGKRIDDPVVSYCNISPDDQKMIFTSQDYNFFTSNPYMPKFLDDFTGGRNLKFLCLPLSVDGEVQRALLLGHAEEYTYDDDKLDQARKIANQLAIGLANSILVDNLEKLAKGTIEALARTVDAKSRWTAGHSERVAELGGKIARVLGLSEKDIEAVIRGGLLHDIGKIAVPITLLDKPEKLTSEEYATIKEHPQIGAQILEPIKAYQDIIPVVWQHHERYDGTGYPLGLAGDNIDMRARILAVADVWDALVSDRPYRGGWIHQRAMSHVLERSGTEFDPKVIDAFLTVVPQE